jgi:fatty acid desaturase (delta-4 desaturase)
MAPDADRLRQRRSKELDDLSNANATEPVLRIATLKTLGETEIVIDGGIYDIKDFYHPGGESIMLFGGNDCTVQYKMIHPYHSVKHLEKMKRVGTVPDYHSEYKWDTPFEREIKKEIFKIVKVGREFGTYGYFARAIFYVCLFFTLQYYWVTTTTTFSLAIVYGVSQALIGLNVQHDGNHGAASKKAWVNELLGLGADFIGGSKWLWMEQHWTHHSFTNHHENDPDSYGAEPMLLWNDYPPDHEKRSYMHQFQAFYYIFVLAGYWLSSVFNMEVFSLQQSGAVTVGINLDNPYVRKSRKYAVGLRVLYIYTNCIAPFVSQGFNLNIIAHIMVMGISSSLTLAILFGLSHNFEHVDRDPTHDTRHGGEDTCWFKAQVETSSTYGGFVSGCLTGGLNFQVEHHLFPRMCSAWYPFIAPTVRRVCKKHGVRYAYYPWVHQNLISTVKYIHAAGTGENWAHGNPYSGTQ